METITRKSLLYRTGVEYGDFCVNHVEGCSHGCKYPCYAMMMKKRTGKIKDYEQWRTPKLVSNALDLLEKEIPKYRGKIRSVHLSFSSDPFMYGQEDVHNLTFEILKKLNGAKIPCTVLTKGVYPLELISKLNGFNEYGITLVSLNEDFRKEYEPYAAPLEERIAALKAVHDMGFKTWVSIEPYPTPNMVKQAVVPILEKVSFVNRIIFGRLNYNSLVSKFKYAKEFYNMQVSMVQSYCDRKSISYYIKKGTATEEGRTVL
jgi:DNA repair photolyase